MEPGQFESLAGHINPDHAAFVEHWMGLIDWEEAGARARRSGIWALPGRSACREGQQLPHGGCGVDQLLEVY